MVNNQNKSHFNHAHDGSHQIKAVDPSADTGEVMNLDKITVITPLQDGYSLIKRHGIEPTFEIWLGTSTNRDYVACFNFSDAVKFLVKTGICADYKQAIKLLNKGEDNDK